MLPLVMFCLIKQNTESLLNIYNEKIEPTKAHQLQDNISPLWYGTFF